MEGQWRQYSVRLASVHPVFRGLLPFGPHPAEWLAHDLWHDDESLPAGHLEMIGPQLRTTRVMEHLGTLFATRPELHRPAQSMFRPDGAYGPGAPSDGVILFPNYQTFLWEPWWYPCAIRGPTLADFGASVRRSPQDFYWSRYVPSILKLARLIFRYIIAGRGGRHRHIFVCQQAQFIIS